MRMPKFEMGQIVYGVNELDVMKRVVGEKVGGVYESVGDKNYMMVDSYIDDTPYRVVEILIKEGEIRYTLVQAYSTDRTMMAYYYEDQIFETYEMAREYVRKRMVGYLEEIRKRVEKMIEVMR